MGERHSLVADVVVGAGAGAAALWAMDRLDWWMYERQGPAARRGTEAARPGGMDPAHVIASRVAGTLGRRLDSPKQNAWGLSVHYSLGAAFGAVYGLIRGRVPGARLARGGAYGLGLFAAEDEVMNPLLGVAGSPEKYPWQDHARGLVAHVAFGVMLDTLLRIARPR